MAWAPCAPRFVQAELEGILRHSSLPRPVREKLEGYIAGLEVAAPSQWSCRFPALAPAGEPLGVEGGLLGVVSTATGVLPPRGARRAHDLLDLGDAFSDSGPLHVTGLPGAEGLKVDGRSGSAAAWLANRARVTARPVPPTVIVSAELVPGAEGEPRLAPVAGGAAKARVVAREVPGGRFLLCGDPDGEAAEVLPAGVPVRELERAVWGDVATADRSQVATACALAADAFKRHDYASARDGYGAVVEAKGGGDGELLLEACLRLAAIDVHSGRPDAAATWFSRAEGVDVPRARKAAYVVERLASLASQAIDAFRPAEAHELLSSTPAMRARDAEHPNDWERIQVLGAWRRLHLLAGEPAEARMVQRDLLAFVDRGERHRALLDLAFVEIRCGDTEAAARTLVQARGAIEGLPLVYGVQSRAFLTWHAARHARRGGALAGLADLLEVQTLEALRANPALQDAGRWRLRAVRATKAGDEAELRALGAALHPFQRWYLGVFLLEAPETQGIGFHLLRDADLDLAGMPVLARAREALRAGRFDAAPFLLHAAY